jgi:hypothetical protein
MQDLDKQLQGMKKNVTGLQVWDTDTTTYYKASGDDAYDYACGKHKADSFFNADGDSTDLKKKISDAIANRTNLQQSATDWLAKYNEAKGRSCPSPCKGKCHSECWSKGRDMTNWGNEVKAAALKVKVNEENITKWQGELTTRLGVEATEAEIASDKKESEAKLAIRKELAKQGLTPEAIESKMLAEGKSKGRNKTLLIGGSLLLVAGFGYFFFRRRNG